MNQTRKLTVELKKAAKHFPGYENEKIWEVRELEDIRNVINKELNKEKDEIESENITTEAENVSTGRTDVDKDSRGINF